MFSSAVRSSSIVAFSLLWFSAGCAAPSSIDEITPAALHVMRQVGGVHRNLLVHDGLLYQTIRDVLVVIDPSNGAVLHEVRILDPGQVGAATELVRLNDELFVILHDDGIARLDLSEPARPCVTEMIEARSLDIQPRRLSLIEDEIYISGEGGVVRLSDRQRAFANPGDVGYVVRGEEGLVATVGRRAYYIDDQRYAGSASMLYEMPDGYGLPGQLAFVRHGEAGSQFGLMTPAIREVDVDIATVLFDDRILGVRFFGGLIWVISGRGVTAFRPDADRLRHVHDIERAGTLDVAQVTDNLIALSGTFGRGVFRLKDDGRNPGQVMVRRMISPGRITEARSDGTSILAFDGRRHWRYDSTTGALDRSDATIPRSGGGQQRAVTIKAEALIEEEGRRLTISTVQGDFSHVESPRARIRCVIAVNEIFWIGHDGGVTLLDPRQSRVSESMITDRVRLPGPVIHLMPLLSGDGAAYASEMGGFGVVRGSS